MNFIAPASSAFKVDISRGQRIGTVSSQWFSRPADQRYLDLDSLYASVRRRHDDARVTPIRSEQIRMEASRTDPDKVSLILPGQAEPIEPTHWSFAQLCSLVGAPAGYLRDLPAPLAAINLQHGLVSDRRDIVKTMTVHGERPELRCVTSESYGRIWDYELVEAVRRIAGNGTGDTRWKVPGALDWSSMTYNPHVNITEQSTTLYASDRDVFVFLTDDTNPVEAGRLPNGDPDLYFRGFYAWNSEVGARTMGLASFYLRAVCQNRILHGVEDFQEVRIRHTKFAPGRFAQEAAPALERFANSSPSGFIRGIQAAREMIVARKIDERRDFLMNRGFSRKDTTAIIDTVIREEGREPESIWDFVQGITARARTITQQDDRLDMERKAQGLLARAS